MKESKFLNKSFKQRREVMKKQKEELENLSYNFKPKIIALQLPQILD